MYVCARVHWCMLCHEVDICRQGITGAADHFPQALPEHRAGKWVSYRTDMGIEIVLSQWIESGAYKTPVTVVDECHCRARQAFRLSQCKKQQDAGIVSEEFI